MLLSIHLIQKIFIILAGICAITSAYFKFLDSYQTKKDRHKSQKFYGKVWCSIDKSGVLSLPEHVIQWLLKQKDRLGRWMLSKAGHIKPFKSLLIEYLIIVLMALIGIYLSYNLLSASKKIDFMLFNYTYNLLYISMLMLSQIIS